MAIEGYIRKIELVEGTTILTVEIVKPYASDGLNIPVEQYDIWKEGYNKTLIEEGRLHLGLISLSQTDKIEGVM